MGLRDRLTRLAVRPHLPRRTVRLRLTALYGALFLASGVGLLAITYLLMIRATGECSSAQSSRGAMVTVCRSSVASAAAPPMGGSQTTEVVGEPAGPSELTQQQADAQARLLETQAVAQRDAQLHELLVQSAIALGAMAIVSNDHDDRAPDLGHEPA
jgi:hypothetical protein